jgi:KaiC/GvpD/RAD55 family RecA-like ATPase
MISLKTGKDVANEAALQIKQLQSGEIQPITTGTPHLDEALMGGFLPGSVLLLAGYSFHGKSYELEKIQRHIAQTYDDVVMINAAWELEGFKIISRDLAFQTKSTVKDILFSKPDEDRIKIFKKVLDSFRRDLLYFQTEPVTADQFEEDIMWAIDQYKDKRIIVSIDNLENILVDKGNQKECMDRMLYRINVLKKRHKFISFIILNQLNNDILKRIENPKSHAPIQSDMYGTGQAFKVADVVLVKVIPGKFGLDEKFMSFHKNSYKHLESFKLPSTTKTTSFDPYGKIFYFYLKARETDKYFQTVYANEMFTRKEMGMDDITDNPVPMFNTEKKPLVPIPAPIEQPIFNPESMTKSRNKFEDSPF